MKPKIIAFYLPQYHPFKENDEWWGKGFTEWTNVAKAKKLFPGHYQPKIPADLGFYDLRLPQVREQQAELAREYGIYGFCYWHYWFGNGKRLMESIFDDVLASKKPDMPFCLAWANHSWYAKLWNTDCENADKLLIEQQYPGEKDIQMHFEYLIKAFKDKRYIRVKGAPLFVIFDPDSIPAGYLDRLQKLAKANGLKNGIYFVANITKRIQTKESMLRKGFSAVTYQRLTSKTMVNMSGRLRNWLNKRIFRMLGLPTMTHYNRAIKYLIYPEIDSQENVIPAIIPNWDHTPRSGKNGSVFIGATPERFYKLVKRALDTIKNKKEDNQIIFLKSWNEWGEGNYVEPDLKYGTGYLKAIKDALNDNLTQA